MIDAEGPALPEGHIYASATVPNSVESIRLAADFIVQAARNMHVPAASDSLFEVAIVEALNNAVKHGNTVQCPTASIVCEVEFADRSLTVRILDQGTGYILPQPPQQEWRADDIATVPESGFGVSIIQSVFPIVRTITRPGEFGIEMVLTC